MWIKRKKYNLLIKQNQFLKDRFEEANNKYKLSTFNELVLSREILVEEIKMIDKEIKKHDKALTER